MDTTRVPTDIFLMGNMSCDSARAVCVTHVISRVITRVHHSPLVLPKKRAHPPRESVRPAPIPWCPAWGTPVGGGHHIGRGEVTQLTYTPQIAVGVHVTDV